MPSTVCQSGDRLAWSKTEADEDRNVERAIVPLARQSEGRRKKDNKTQTAGSGMPCARSREESIICRKA